MKKGAKIHILIVCTGNTCRSPMAKAILEKLLKEKKLKIKVAVNSAGIISLGGSPASRTAVEVCRENGVDLSGHQSKRLTENLIQDADLIIVMEQMHQELLLKSSAVAQQKIRLLSEFAADRSVGSEIRDPYGGDKYHYEQAYRDIELCLQGLVSSLEGSITV
ncbi:MAG: low molecular weight protein arginine phosphatase [Candidatus Glassbacteria bacterium]|nr:low molecular weight protein arginine phosphatase [Candidatus Glassbacteria bacterium]